MVGNAVPTTVWSRDARKMVSRTAPRIASFLRGGKEMSGVGAAAGSLSACTSASMGRPSLAAKFSSPLRGRELCEHVLGGTRDDFDARVDRYRRAVENHVVVARILPGPRSRMEMSDVSPPRSICLLLLDGRVLVAEQLVRHRGSTPGFD